MRKTRLVLIPGVKSLNSIGCLLLFLACPTIAFKGQENREVDAICQTQNLKEFWVDSPWPGDEDNIGWIRGFGGGIRPGNLQKQNTCDALSTRSVVQSSRSDVRRVLGRREGSRDNGMESRKIRMENYLRRDMRREVAPAVRQVRDSRRTSEGNVLVKENRIDSRRTLENGESRTSTRSLGHDVRSERDFRDDSRRQVRERSDTRTRSVERRSVTTREVIDGNRNSRAAIRNVDREVRSKREVRESETRRAFTRERTDATMSAERTVRNREVVEGRRLSARSIDNRTDRQTRNMESRRSSLTRDAAEERVVSLDRQNVESRRVNSRDETRSLEREIRSNRKDASHQDTRAERRNSEERMREAERRVINRLDQERLLNNERRSVERQVVDNRRALDERRQVRIEREARQSSTERIGENRAERFTNNREVIDGRVQSTRSLHREIRNKREVREPEGYRATRRSSDSRLRETSRIESRREYTRESMLSTRSIDGRSVEGARDNRRVAREDSRSYSRVADERRNEIRRERENRQSVRSVEREARLDNRELSVGRRDSRQSTFERDVRSEREFTDRRAQELRESRVKFDDVARSNRRTGSRRDSVISVRSLDNQRTDRVNRETQIDSRRTQEREALERATPTRVSRQDIQRADVRRDERQRRSLDANRQNEIRIHRAASGRQTRLEIRETRDLDRSSMHERIDHGRIPNQIIRNQRLSRSLDDFRRMDRQFRNVQADQETRQMGRIEERQARSMETAFDRVSRRIADPSRLTRENTRSQREIRTEGGIRAERTIQAESRRENRVADYRQYEIERETRAARQTADNARADIRVREDTRTQTRRIREVRSLDRETHRETTRSDSRRGEVENFTERNNRRLAASDRISSLTRDEFLASQRQKRESREIRSADERRAERDSRRIDRRESGVENRQSAIVRRFNNRDSRDTNVRRDATSTLESLQRERRESRQIQSADERRAERDARRIDRREVGVENRQSAVVRRFNNRDSRDTNVRRLARDATSTLDSLQRERRESREVRSADERRAERETRSIDRREVGIENRQSAVVRRFNNRDSRDTNIRRLARDATLTIESLQRERRENREIRSADERRAERETRSIDRREFGVENRQSADVRRFNKRDSRDTNIRRLARDATSTIESLRTLPKEFRRSDRQRRVTEDERDLTRNMDKRRDTQRTYTTEAIRRLSEYTELSNKPRRSDIREKYSSKMERDLSNYHQELSNEGKDNFFVASKNALASWITTDISRTDLNGIAETLMYGGIACFALFSNVNKKVIF